MTNAVATLAPPLRAASFEELFTRAEEAKETLADRARACGIAREKSDVEIWYRGVPRMIYKLAPSFFRFHAEPGTERKLYAEFVEHTAPPEKDWQVLYKMQQHFIPTRLLDWTASFGVALHFALNSDESPDNPIVWLLHPGILNQRAMRRKDLRSLFLEGAPVALNTADLEAIKYSYSDYCGGSKRIPRVPLCVTPEAQFPRLAAQRGRFTIHGSDHQPLEELCPECVHRVVISNKAVQEIRDRIDLTGIDAFSIFPDLVGLAGFLRRRHDLVNVTSVKTLLSRILQLWADDLDVLTTASRRQGAAVANVSMSGIGNCVVSEAYLERSPRGRGGQAGVEEKLRIWMSEDRGGICIVTGEAGSGKTNCLLNVVISERLFETRPVIWFPLFCFDHEKGLIGSLDQYLRGILGGRTGARAGRRTGDRAGEHMDEDIPGLTSALSELLRRSDSILVLDGLDELSRTKGRDAAIALAKALAEAIPQAKENAVNLPKVVISCRDDIYHNIKEDFDLGRVTLLGPIEPLREDAVRDRLEGISYNADILGFLAQYPLFLRFLHGQNLPADVLTKSGRLFEALAPKGGPGREENLRALGKVACQMLRDRQDVLEPSAFRKLARSSGMKHDRFFQPTPLQALLRERNGDVRFLHHTIREFVLGWNIHDSLTLRAPKRWDMLMETSDLDYEGAEVHSAVADLWPGLRWDIVRGKWEQIRDRTRKNNFAWCCFETAGMLGFSSEEMPNEQKRQRGIVVDWILDALSGPLDGHDKRYSFHAKYNAVRCLERLHPSAPPCYWKWVTSHRRRKTIHEAEGLSARDTAESPHTDPRDHMLPSYAVRGWQLAHVKIGAHRSLQMLDKGKRGKAQRDPQQCVVSEILVEGIRCLTSYAEHSEQQFHVLVNMSHALIRWYSPEHRGKIDVVLRNDRLEEEVTANLRMALWYWHPKLKDDRISNEDGIVTWRSDSDGR